MNNIFHPKYRSYANAFVLASSLCLLAGNVGVALSDTLPMPNSEVSYSGASAVNAFVAVNPYYVNIEGVSTYVELWGPSRTHDFGGSVPFVNTSTGESDIGQIQAQGKVIDTENITNAGFHGRVEKQTVGGIRTTMVRYNAGDVITVGTCRTKVANFAVPNRVHAKWELEVAFGNTDGVNDWALTPSGASPVVFWAITSPDQLNGPLGLQVDTDSLDNTKLMVSIHQRVGPAPNNWLEIGLFHGLERHTQIPIVVEAFLDERAIADGGKGLLRIWINGALAVEKQGPTMAFGPSPSIWSMNTYLWNETAPYSHTRATFWKTARMIVYPPTGSVADITPPTAPTQLAANAPNSTTVNLSWTASTDDKGVAGYNIYRDGAQIGTSAVASFTDNTVAEKVTYSYTVKAYDGTGNLSALSNAATVQTPVTAVNVTSYSVGNITAIAATINFTTNIATTGVVSFGTSSGKLASTVSDANKVTKHSITITGLVKSTKYYYNITANSGYATGSSLTISSFQTNRR